MIIVVSERPAVLVDLMPLLPWGVEFGSVLISQDLGDVPWSTFLTADAVLVDTASIPRVLDMISTEVLATLTPRLVLVAPDSQSPPWPAVGDIRPAYVAWLTIPGARAWLAYWLAHRVTGEPMITDEYMDATLPLRPVINDPPLPSDLVRGISQ